MKPFLVDVPVRVQIWTRPECQRQQLEVLKKARPSIIFLTSDGGRNEAEWEKIRESRKIMEDIDWDCTVHRIFMDENKGMYAFGKIQNSIIWSTVDRCIFLEDDYVPSVSYFSFCAELLEKYKDDQRIEMISGYNMMGVYEDALPNDYFFSEQGWSIWGTAMWKRTMDDYIYPLPYANDCYIAKRLKENLDDFSFGFAEKYMSGELADNHVPGGEYYHSANSALNHRLTVVPTRNMISNIGNSGEHTVKSKAYAKIDALIYETETYEIEGSIKHPDYLIDDKYYHDWCAKMLLHGKKYRLRKLRFSLLHAFEMIFSGQLFIEIKRRKKNKITIEK